VESGGWNFMVKIKRAKQKGDKLSNLLDRLNLKQQKEVKT